MPAAAPGLTWDDVKRDAEGEFREADPPAGTWARIP